MTRRVLQVHREMDRTYGLAVITPILFREADGVVVASVFVFALNFAHPVFFLTLTFLPAVAGVPLFIELGETDDNHRGARGLERLSGTGRCWGVSLYSPGVCCRSRPRSHTVQ